MNADIINENKKIDYDYEKNNLSNESLETLQEKLQKTILKEQENWDLYLRAKADSENIKKFYEKNINREQNRKLFEFFKDLLVVIDSIEFGLKNTLDDLKNEQFKIGLKAIYDLFLSIFEKYGISIINPINSFFDPNVHEVVNTESVMSSLDHNKVISVIQNGYMCSGIILRSAKVVLGSFSEKENL